MLKNLGALKKRRMADIINITDMTGDEAGGFFVDAYNLITAPIPEQYRIIVNITFYTLLIAVYAIFIWKFYRFLARRDVIKLNLSQYNRTERPFLNKFLAIIFFLVEYIIILPVLVFFWFAILAVFLLVFSKSESVEQILLISAGIVAATRLTAYFSQDLSKELAKLFPFTVLAIFLLGPDFFSLRRLIPRFSEIPTLLNQILIFLIFIIVVEVILRGAFSIVDLFTSSEETLQTEETVKSK